MMMLAIVTGKSFNFHVIETLQNATEGEQLCREMSYDGLAILSSPEMYNYALTITHTLRASTTRGMYIGLKYSPETAVTHWEDGTLPAADTPWKDATVAQEEFGLLFSAGLLRMTKGRYHRYALCGSAGQYRCRAAANRREFQSLCGHSSILHGVCPVMWSGQPMSGSRVQL
ncbi:hypothetical protein RRG08_048861 [Elysia crispata]|uniref:Uncharacterized protein n=1 Tax=Elysia crispata TaxID=231223 RepID=A0AAE1AGJ3_9GAST|nr:hypothetical protein RRG08_048861 [Elysia crispata]